MAPALRSTVPLDPRIVPVADNYDRLGYPAEAITRDTRYTRYVDAGNMLRSHSSAMIPPALGRLARQPGDDVLLVCPGIVYRRDAIDWQHAGTPHQLDLWRITQRTMSSTDMAQMIAILLGAQPAAHDGQAHPRHPAAPFRRYPGHLHASADAVSASRTVAARPRPFEPAASMSGL